MDKKAAPPTQPRNSISVTQSTAIRQVQTPATATNTYVARTPVTTANKPIAKANSTDKKTTNVKKTDGIRVKQNLIRSKKIDNRPATKNVRSKPSEKTWKTVSSTRTINVIRGTLKGLQQPINAYVARTPVNTYVAKTPIALTSTDNDKQEKSSQPVRYDNVVAHPARNVLYNRNKRSFRNKVLRKKTSLFKDAAYDIKQTLKEQSYAQNELSSNVVGGVISGAEAAVTTWKVAEAAPYVPAKVVKTVIKIVKAPSAVAKAVTETGAKTMRVVRGVASGKIALTTLGKEAVKRGVPRAVKSGKITAKYSAKGLVSATQMIAGNNNDVGQAINTNITATKYAFKGVKTSYNAAKRTYYTGKQVHKYAKRAHGFAKTMIRGNRTVKKAATKTVTRNIQKLVVAAAKVALKLVAKKVLAPVALIAAAILLLFQTFTAPVSAGGVLFGGMFERRSPDGTITEYDIAEYVRQTVTEYRVQFAQELLAYAGQNQSSYNYVRIFNSGFTCQVDNAISLTENGILANTFSVEQLTNIAQPLFNAVILMDYELAPSESESAAVMENILTAILRFEPQTLQDEWCTYDEHPTVPLECDECGNVYVEPGCPAQTTGTHITFTCSTCCSYVAPPRPTVTRTPPRTGTPTPTPSVTRAPTPTPAPVLVCSGYAYCQGHSVLGLVIVSDGLFALEHQYFHQPMEAYRNEPNRTPEQEQRLRLLEDIYELYLEFIRMQNLNTGHLNISDLTGVNFLEGDRPGHAGVVNMAMNFAQMGYRGGATFWRWFPFPQRDEWCAMFVSYLWHANGVTDRPHFAWCPAGADWFRARGQWHAGQWTPSAAFVPVAGDAIFFNYGGSSITNHVAIVAGVSECSNFIFIIDGNWGDAVVARQIPIQYQATYGFGLMNF